MSGTHPLPQTGYSRRVNARAMGSNTAVTVSTSPVGAVRYMDHEPLYAKGWGSSGIVFFSYTLASNALGRYLEVGEWAVVVNGKGEEHWGCILANEDHPGVILHIRPPGIIKGSLYP